MPVHAIQWVAFAVLAAGLVAGLWSMTSPTKRRNRGPSNEGLTDWGSVWQGSDDAGPHHGAGHDGALKACRGGSRTAEPTLTQE